MGTRPPSATYGVALLSVSAALAARALLIPLVGPERFPFPTLFAAIAVASWYGGFGPALVSVFLGALAADWLFVSPRFTVLPRTVDGAVGFAFVLVSGVLIAALGEALQRARRHAEASAAEASSAESSFADSEARAHAVLDTTASAIISIDTAGRIATFNQAAERMFGYAAAAVIGQNVKLLMPAPYHEEHDDYLRRYLETGVPRIIGIGREVTGRRKDGTTFPIDLAVTDTVLHGDHLFTGVIRDLTREKEAEAREQRLVKQALQNERLIDIGAMTARIAHDLGNPLAGLSMTAQRILRLMARTPTAPLASIREAVNAIVATTAQLDTLITGFKDFAREQRLDLQEIRLPTFLLEIAVLWEAEAAARNITLTVEAPPDVPPIRADAAKLRRVFDNLVRNALEALVQGPGVVRIATTIPTSEKVRVVVEDTGPGIPEGLDVFALFETTKTAGTGLGLAICKQIVVAHGGGITFAPRTPTGTVFYVDLPLSTPRLSRDPRAAG